VWRLGASRTLSTHSCTPGATLSRDLPKTSQSLVDRAGSEEKILQQRKSPINSLSHRHKKSPRAAGALQAVPREKVLLCYPETNHLLRVSDLPSRTWLAYSLCLSTVSTKVAFNSDFC